MNALENGQSTKATGNIVTSSHASMDGLKGEERDGV